MHKRGLCRRAVSVCLCVCLSCSWVVKTNKDIFEICSPSGSHTILIFPYQTIWRYSDGNHLNGASNAGGIGRNRDSEPMCLLLTPQQARCCKHGRRWTTATISQVVTIISLVIYCGYSTTKRHARYSHRLRGSSAQERPSALSHYRPTQAR